MKLAPTEAFVSGRSRAKAVELLARADELGFPQSVVRTTSGGYVVPKAFLTEQPEETPVPEFDPATRTVAEVEEYLASADTEETERVIQAEKAGKNRKGIVENIKE